MTKTSVSVLLIEDDKQIRRFVRTELESREMTVVEATTGREGVLAASTRKADLFIVDLGLPDMDGLEVIRQIRTWSQTPLIVLSARSREMEKVAAFEAGADDYLTKPFGVAELMARLHALLRRHNRLFKASDAGADHIDGSRTTFGNVSIDITARAVTRAGTRLHLTQVEFRLLSTLVRNNGRVMTHRQLLTEVWGPTHAEDTHYLRVYMGNLRQKLEDDPAQPKHLITETGVGYRLAGLDG